MVPEPGTLAAGDRPEPRARVIGEEQVVAEADRLIANTEDEARQLVQHYGADPRRTLVVPPGVDLDRFRPADRVRNRRAAGVPDDAVVLLFVGRIQPLRGVDGAVRTLAALDRPDASLVIVGGASGQDGDAEVAHRRDRLVRALAGFDAATIATTHSFCSQMLAGLGIVADADPSATFTEDIDDLVDFLATEADARRS